MDLPFCKYPTASDTTNHGLYHLPKDLPVVEFEELAKYRIKKYNAVQTSENDKLQLLDMAKLVAKSFALNEPMNRHLHPPKKIPRTLILKHRDYFGKDEFGPWTTENIIFWFIRLIVLTRIDDMAGVLNLDTVRLSVVIKNEDHNPIGAAFNVTVFPAESEMRKNDPFLEAVFLYLNPIMNKIVSQEHDAIESLVRNYPDFEEAYLNRQIAMHFMIARSEKLPTNDTFELVAASAEHLQKLGYRYMVVTATNQWTGAACEALNGQKVHFSPYRTKKVVATTEEASENEPYSADGYVSNKDSGMMFYVIKLV